MRKKILAPLLLFVLFAVSFINKKEISKQKNIIECISENNTNNTILFRAPAAINVRKNYTTLSPTEKGQIVLAISKMKALSLSNPSDRRGWNFQVNLHKLQCEHGTCYFLAWHRMYIYYFERILQSFMDPALPKPGLPFWNHKLNKKIPVEFITDPNLINTSRDASTLSTTFKIPKSINTNYNNALAEKDFYLFQKKMENAHDGVHQAINGDMITTISPNDPIFFIHHANVDRQWEIWRNKKYGRCNPTATDDPSWWAKQFTFYNENGIAETLTCGQIISTISAALGYEYEKVSTTGMTSACKRKTFNCPILEDAPTASIVFPNKTINSKQTTYNYAATNHTNFDIELNKFGNGNFNLSSLLNTNKIILSFEDIVATKYASGVVEVYVHKKDKTAFDATDASFVGFLPLFSAATLAEHKMHGIKNKLELDLIDVVKQLRIKPKEFKNLRITFFVRGNEVNGIEVPVDVNINIGKTILSLY